MYLAFPLNKTSLILSKIKASQALAIASGISLSKLLHSSLCVFRLLSIIV